jgi:hypothetical protein
MGYQTTRPKTLTVRHMIQALSALDPDRPVLIATPDGDYLNIVDINADTESHAATIETADDFSTTQW